MIPKKQDLLNAALALPESQRAELVQHLLASLSPDLPDTDEDDFLAELERRSAECHNDPTSTIPWSELKGKR